MNQLGVISVYDKSPLKIKHFKQMINVSIKNTVVDSFTNKEKIPCKCYFFPKLV